MSSDEVKLSRNDLVKVLRYLNMIVVSLDQIGSCAHDVSGEEYHRLSSKFLDDWFVCGMLGEARTLLSKPFSYDELEDLFGDIPHWRYSAQMPPATAGIPEPPRDDANDDAS